MVQPMLQLPRQREMRHDTRAGFSVLSISWWDLFLVRVVKTCSCFGWGKAIRLDLTFFPLERF
jgi:hypothetical protein